METGMVADQCAEVDGLAEQEAVLWADAFEDPQIECAAMGPSMNSYPKPEMMKCC
jgi:hypothetical protein